MSTRDETHVHCWERRQNVTSKGYAMAPIEVCAEPECGAARIVGDIQPAQRNDARPMSAEVTLTEDEREALRAQLAKWSRSDGRVGAILGRNIAPAVERIVAARVEQARADERERIAIEIDTAAWTCDYTADWRDGMTDAARIAREGGPR